MYCIYLAPVLNFNYRFGIYDGALSSTRIFQSFDEWNRRLEHGDAHALRYLLAGVPALAEWTAEGVDLRGECQQMAATVVVGILGLDT